MRVRCDHMPSLMRRALDKNYFFPSREYQATWTLEHCVSQLQDAAEQAVSVPYDDWNSVDNGGHMQEFLVELRKLVQKIIQGLRRIASRKARAWSHVKVNAWPYGDFSNQCETLVAACDKLHLNNFYQPEATLKEINELKRLAQSGAISLDRLVRQEKLVVLAGRRKLPVDVLRVVGDWF